MATQFENESTAAISTLEKCREITGCPAGVDLQDWVKRLAAERDEALNAERIWEKTMMEVCGEDGSVSVACEIRSLHALRDTAMQALKSQVGQLAAENVGLKAAFSPEEIPAEAVDAFMDTAVMDHDWNDTSEWSWVENETEVIRAVLDALKPETPATDRIYAGIKADGVEMFAKSRRELAKKATSMIMSLALEAEAQRADDFAKHLREGAK